MAVGFQLSAFQNNAFQTDSIVSTQNLPFPINCVLMGQQLYEKTGRSFEKMPGRSGTRVRARSSSLHQLGESPSFSVTSNTKGYD